MGCGFDFPRRAGKNHATFIAVVADVVRLLDLQQCFGFAHDMRSEIAQRPAMSEA
jgi:hypothetical protein